MIPGARPTLRRLSDIVDQLVDARVGVVRFLEEIPREPGGPDFFHVYARACDTQYLSGQKNFWATGGAAIDRERATAKAIGEAVERYCAALFDAEELGLGLSGGDEQRDQGEHHPVQNETAVEQHGVAPEWLRGLPDFTGRSDAECVSSVSRTAREANRVGFRREEEGEAPVDCDSSDLRIL